MIRRFVKRWLGWWGLRSVTVESPLPPEAAEAALLRALPRWSLDRQVRGRAAPEGVQLWVHQPFTRNFWRLKFAGDFTARPLGGSVLEGDIGASAAVQVLMALWLIGASVLTVFFERDCVTALLAGPWARVPQILLGMLAPLAIVAMGVLLVHLGGLAGEKDEKHLRDWLQRHVTQAAPTPSD